MKMFVTGSTGKVGSRLIPRILQQGHHVKILVRDATKVKKLQQQGVEIVEGDLLYPESYKDALRGTDVVIHLAAQFRGVDEHTTKITNLDGSLALAQTVLQIGVPRFVFASTSNVYGNGHTRPNREDDELRATDAYPVSKIEAEKELLTLHHEQGLGLRIVRLPFVYGDNDPHIEEIIPFLRDWNPAKRMHMGHHVDVAQGLMLAATSSGIDGQIYNVADDAPISVAELLELYNIVIPAEASQQEFDPWDMIMDTTRIRKELHYRPIYPSFYTAKDADAL
ncbi:NAD-dependent epimerase/dehydratase family protein [Paenibacillus dauci]|uniref:NAD-dependent epimerase/dehydratase family protein n=1 Tax=Paenibacillus dauci TaxID=1567106 RepID=UPI00061A0AD8|nr:NAD(P)-dependent oxidoreductase [Paenibacillus dauci]